MSRKLIIISFAIIVVLIVVGIVFMSGNDEGNLNATGNVVSDTSSATSSNSSSTTTSSSISVEELAKHNNMQDCWVGFQGKAYDITSWLPKHPGTAGAILLYCGTAKEFEDAFVKKHGQTKVTLFMKIAIFMGDLKFQGNING